MDCPKCRTPNPDDAAFCSLCYESFRQKKPSAAPCLVVPRALCSAGKWIAAGPLLVREDGLYVFVKSLEDRDKAVMRAASGGGLVGALAFEAANALAGEDAPPEFLRGRPAKEARELVERHGEEAPELRVCRNFFVVARSEISELAFDFVGQLNFKARELDFRVSGFDDKAKLSGFLVLRGYPLKR